ncbi:tyrosine-type recombinase/integrase [Sphingopyxis sp.]|uniref:tyrosine-type recombinase/integrase n=1 Tax=Sphingopyxis sp. TaxID=1908224 RepID=UPI0035B36B07
MPKQAAILGPLAVKNLKETGLHFVGEVPGLALQVLPTGARTWILRLTVGNRRRDMGLGGFPEISLADARAMARQARQRVREGFDPIEERRALRQSLRDAQANRMTFKEAAEAYVSSKRDGWKSDKHAAQWSATLKNYAYPEIGEKPIAEIELPEILKVLEPIWSEKPETASRLRGRMENVLDWAKTRGHREGLNPARWRGHLDNQLAKPGKLKEAKNRRLGKDGHFAAMPIYDAYDFLKRLRGAGGMAARALEFAILTASRSGEVRGARWSEIDIKAGIWTVPASRMKAGKQHRVLLPKPAIELLNALPRLADTDLVFWAPRGGQLSDMSLLAVMRRMGEDATPHGFRSTFRDWVSELTNYPGDMAEMALAHTISDKVEAAYRRGDMVQKRRRMMDHWAAFLASPPPAETAGNISYIAEARA